MPENIQSGGSSGVSPRLAAYVPDRLPPLAWSLARPAVLAAVSGLGGEALALRAASVVCRLLAEPAWDRTQAPDLTVLLDDATVVAVVESWSELPSASKVAHRALLRRVARQVTPRRGPAPILRGQAGTARFWVALRWCGPLTVLVVAAARRGLVLHGGSWKGANGQMLAGASLSVIFEPGQLWWFGDGSGGTVGGVSQAVRALRGAEAVEGTPSMPATGTSKSPHTGGRRPTRRKLDGTTGMAALRQARRDAAAPAPAAGLAPLPELPEAVVAAIEAYRPLKMAPGVWERIAEATRWAFAAYRPPTPRWLSTHGGYVARYCAWVAATTGVNGADRLTPVALLGDGLIDAYMAGGLEGRPSTVATVRSVLRRVLENMSSGPAAVRYPHAALQPPYTAQECRRWVRLARHQPTRAKRRTLSAAVALGLGAGLDSRDQRLVRACDIITIDVDGDPALAVRVSGQRARTVVVSATYEGLLREALALHTAEGRADDDLLHGRDVNRLKVVAAVSDAAVTAEGPGIDLSAARMRTTWLLAVACAPVPLAVLLTASGLTSGRTLADLIPYFPEPDPPDVARLLHRIDQGVAK